MTYVEFQYFAKFWRIGLAYYLDSGMEENHLRRFVKVSGAYCCIPCQHDRRLKVHQIDYFPGNYLFLSDCRVQVEVPSPDCANECCLNEAGLVQFDHGALDLRKSLGHQGRMRAGNTLYAVSLILYCSERVTPGRFRWESKLRLFCLSCFFFSFLFAIHFIVDRKSVV